MSAKLLHPQTKKPGPIRVGAIYMYGDEICLATYDNRLVSLSHANRTWTDAEGVRQHCRLEELPKGTEVIVTAE